MKTNYALFWFRRDLRLHDNTGLYHALSSGLKVIPFFLFDKSILDKLEEKDDARVSFIHREISRIKDQLKELGSDLLVEHGTPEEVFNQILENYPIREVYTNRDYEPQSIERDEKISQLLMSRKVEFFSFKDQVIFEQNEVVKDNREPYLVFTPYSKAWKKRLMEDPIKQFPSETLLSKMQTQWEFPLPSLETLGFTPSQISFPPAESTHKKIIHYHQTRDYPAVDGTSKLGVHFRFGTISIREKAKKAQILNETFLNELIWRDFYHMILFHFPHVSHQAFKKEFDFIPWRNDIEEFKLWCLGKTGYPLVDAGMRELKATGYMHNRVRMVVASFLCKHLLIDWRWGEAWFARKLLDFDLASNNGGWQWAAGTGVDAAPYFRVFNPALQMEKFDKDLRYVKKWVPEYGTRFYPKPMVDHEFARKRCLEAYGVVKSKKNQG